LKISENQQVGPTYPPKKKKKTKKQLQNEARGVILTQPHALLVRSLKISRS
jgi:hypothetical protein